MRLRYPVIGMALGAILWALAPAVVAAGDRPDSHPDAKVSAPARSFELQSLRDRFDPGASRRRFDEHPHPGRWDLREFGPVFVQKPACHPRGKPPHPHFGWGGPTPVGFFPGAGFGRDDDDKRGHGDHGGHGPPGDGHPGHGQHGHGPPFCPSPH